MQETREGDQTPRNTAEKAQNKAQMRTKARKRRAKALKKARNEENGDLPKHICRCRYIERRNGAHSPPRKNKEWRKRKEPNEKRYKSPNGPSIKEQGYERSNAPGRGVPSGLPQDRRDGEGSETA